jgi:hypothetical protein
VPASRSARAGRCTGVKAPREDQARPGKRSGSGVETSLGSEVCVQISPELVCWPARAEHRLAAVSVAAADKGKEDRGICDVYYECVTKPEEGETSDVD